MKIYKYLLLILVLVTVSQASPRRHGSNRHFARARVVHLHAGFYGNAGFYNSAYGPWMGQRGYYGAYYGWYDPMIYVRADSVRLIYMDAETVGNQITRLDELRKQGLITDKEFKRLKKRLLSQMGKMVPISRQAIQVGQLLDELEILYQLFETGVLTDGEYASQKRRMLARL